MLFRCHVPYKRMCFSHFLSNRLCIKQSFDRLGNIDSNNSSMTNTILVPSVTKTINTKPVVFKRIKSFSGKRKLATPGVDSKTFLQKEYQKNLPLLSQMPEDQAQSLITNWPGVSKIAGVAGDELIPLHVL